MAKKAFILIILYLVLGGLTFAQEVQKSTIQYTPDGNGYELNIPFAWKFINCYGEVHVTITKNTKKITSSAYHYNGTRYTANELGSEAFVKPECGLTNLRASVYHNAFRMGDVELDNVIDWLGGCFGQTYHVIKLLGLNDADYKEKVSELSLSNLTIESLSSRDYTIEGKIKEIEKNKSLIGKLGEADNAFSSGDFETAKKLYKEALKIDYSNAHAKERLAQIKEKEKSEKQEKEFQKHLQQGKDLQEKGDYDGARREFQKALNSKPDDEEVKEKLNDINNLLSEEKKAQKNKSKAISSAKKRNHKGLFWGQNYSSDSYGTATQASTLIGNFRLDYNIWTLSGEPAHKFKFYWEWSNSLNTGYPQWVSVLHDTVVMIKELEKYPELMQRWNSIKPIYIEVECKILYYKNEDEYVADVGTIKVVPEVIGYSGQEVDWSLPSSSNWDELFTYCNGMEWSYFRKLGLYDEIHEHEDKHGTSISWAKYAFEHSDQINFYQGYSLFHSEFKELSSIDYDNFSSAADIVKVVWPVEEIQAVIRAFEEKEKQKEEEKMESEDFWNSPESEKKSSNTDFWNTPENEMTKTEKKKIDTYNTEIQEMVEENKRITWGRKKYEALHSPFSISYPGNNAVVEVGKIDFKGQVHPFLKQENANVEVRIEDEIFSCSNQGKYFSSSIILKEGWNTVSLDIIAEGFGFNDSVKIFYKKPPPLPCDELTKSGSGKAINEHGLGKESGSFLIEWDFYGAYDEMTIYAGPKERRGYSNILYETDGTGVGQKRIYFENIDGAIITVEFNKGVSGSSWEYLINCPK